MSVLAPVRRLAGLLERARYERRRARRGKDCVETVLGLELYVPEGVLNPALFGTGALLAQALLADLPTGCSVLDLGAGSGIVGLAAARRGARVTAIDLSPSAVSAVRINAMLNRLELEVIAGDLFAPLVGRRFDRIAFNPPFFTRRQGGVLEMALSDAPGLPLYDRFLAELGDHLTPRGVALVAGSTNGALAVMRSLAEKHGWRWRTVRARERVSERLVVDELVR